MLSKIFLFLARMSSCAEVLGIKNCARVLKSRFSATGHLVLPDNQPFYFRGKLDHGVIYHFFKPGYYIRSEEIRTIVDAGANIGDESRRFSIHHPNAQILALEIEDANFRCLERNLTKNIRALRKALWHCDGKLFIEMDKNPESHSVCETDTGLTVDAISIPTILNNEGWENIDILKLDIEGSEKLIFESCDEWIDNVNVIILEVCDKESEFTLCTLFGKLKSRFNAFIVGENLILIKAGFSATAEAVCGFKRN